MTSSPISPTQYSRRATEVIGPDSVTVVIPVLNEHEGIGIVLDDLRKEGFENILVVDGYSTDGTQSIAERKGATVISQQGTGKAGAIRTAIDVVRTPYLVVMDGDGTYRAVDIHRLLTYAPSHDEIIGARTNGRQHIPRFNRIGNRLISTLFKLLFDQPISDVLSGMYLIKTEKLREVEITSTSFDVEVEIASSIAASGSISQVPIGYFPRVGKQKLRPSHGGRILGTLFWMANYYNPVLFYGIILSFAAIPAAVILLWTVYEAVFFGVWHGTYALFAIMLFLFATQAAAVTMISLLVKRSENRIMRRLRSK
jgi:dolichol-phosphate hexosyltransferase